MLMPVLKNPRHERLAQALAKGLDYTEAGKEAGYTGERSSICGMLSDNPNISQRIQELQQVSAENTGVTVEWLIERFRAIAQKAEADEDYANAARSLENLAKNCGFYAKDNEQAGTFTFRTVSYKDVD